MVFHHSPAKGASLCLIQPRDHQHVQPQSNHLILRDLFVFTPGEKHICIVCGTSRAINSEMLHPREQTRLPGGRGWSRRLEYERRTEEATGMCRSEHGCALSRRRGADTALRLFSSRQVNKSVCWYRLLVRTPLRSLHWDPRRGYRTWRRFNTQPLKDRLCFDVVTAV